MEKRIVIEPLLFDDYYVAVYNELDELLLDKKYYCHGFLSAYETAKQMIVGNKNYKDCKVMMCLDGEETDLSEIIPKPEYEERNLDVDIDSDTE